MQVERVEVLELISGGGPARERGGLSKVRVTVRARISVRVRVRVWVRVRVKVRAEAARQGRGSGRGGRITAVKGQTCLARW